MYHWYKLLINNTHHMQAEALQQMDTSMTILIAMHIQ